jgi:hypothetical protein
VSRGRVESGPCAAQKNQRVVCGAIVPRLRERFMGRMMFLPRLVPTPVEELGGFLRFVPRRVDLFSIFTAASMRACSSSLHSTFTPATGQ